MTRRYVRTGVQCLVVTAAAVAAAQPAAFPDTDLEPAVPAPAGVIGHKIGAAAVRYDAMVRYLHALADASEFVTLTPYAESHEGRRLHYLTITCAGASRTCPGIPSPRRSASTMPISCV